MISGTNEMNIHFSQEENNPLYSNYNEERHISDIKFLKKSDIDVNFGQCACAIPSAEHLFDRKGNQR